MACSFVVLVLAVFDEVLWSNFRAVNITFTVGGNTIGKACPSLRIGVRDEGRHPPILNQTDANASVNPGIVTETVPQVTGISGRHGLRFGVGHVKNVAWRDKNSC